MKVKYYMRGIGVGIILTVIVCSLGNKALKNEMTDQEIMAAAKKLGMVESDTDLNLDALKGTVAPTSLPDENVDSVITITPKPTIDEDLSITPQPTVYASITSSPDTANEVEVTPLPSPTIEIEITPSPEPTVSVIPEPTLSTDTAKMIMFEIESGMYSEAVSKVVQNAGLIKDWKDFNSFLISNGYASNIRTNKYSIQEGASYTDIAELITKRP